MSYIFLFYCFLTVVLITGGTFFFYESGSQLTGVIYFLGSIIAGIFFGFRWFAPNQGNTAPGSWPPSINYCPDFMSIATVNNTKACIDTVGVATQGGISTSDGTKTEDKYIFDLYLDKSGQDRATLLCNQAKDLQVTWEGVWNGTSCSNVDPPKP
jgi:hypothetical protein